MMDELADSDIESCVADHWPVNISMVIYKPENDGALAEMLSFNPKDLRKNFELGVEMGKRIPSVEPGSNPIHRNCNCDVPGDHEHGDHDG